MRLELISPSREMTRWIPNSDETKRNEECEVRMILFLYIFSCLSHFLSLFYECINATGEN